MFKLALNFLLVGLLFFMFTGSGSGVKKPIGTVVLKLGNVFCYSKGQSKKEIDEYGKVYPGDRIVTGDSAFLKVRMIDDSVIRVGSNSIFLFKKFEVLDTMERVVELVQEKGAVRALFKVKAVTGSVMLNSKNLVSNVDGTEFVSDVNVSGDKSLHRMAILSGEARVTGSNKSEKIVRAGEMAEIDSSMVEPSVKKIDPFSLTRLNKDKDSFLPEVELIPQSKVKKKKKPPVNRTGRGSSGI